jgi:hypothetical protein
MIKSVERERERERERESECGPPNRARSALERRSAGLEYIRRLKGMDSITHVTSARTDTPCTPLHFISLYSLYSPPFHFSILPVLPPISFLYTPCTSLDFFSILPVLPSISFLHTPLSLHTL